MTLAYAPHALIYDDECYSLRPDFDPETHRVDIDLGALKGADWNAKGDPSIAQVRDLAGEPIAAGHAYVSDRLRLIGPHGLVRVDVLEIAHHVVGFIADSCLEKGTEYRVAGELPYLVPDLPIEMPGFGPGTLIATPQGEVPVEWLAKGDQVLTMDHGPQPLRWIGAQRVSARQLAPNAGLRPVRLLPGQFGDLAPLHPLTLAPGTRVMLSGADLELHFGLDLALARACDLAEPGGVGFAGGLTYFTLLFDQHRVVCANGLWCESLFVEASGLGAPGTDFPAHIRHDKAAFPCLRDWEALMLSAPAPSVAKPLWIAA